MTEFVNDVFGLFTLRPMDSGFRRNDGMNFKMSTEPTMTARVIQLSLRGAQPLMVSLSNHVAISLRLSTCRGTIIATATRLPPPYQVRGRNDMRKTERSYPAPRLS